MTITAQKIINFILLKGKNTSQAKRNIRFLKKSSFYLSAAGLAQGAVFTQHQTPLKLVGLNMTGNNEIILAYMALWTLLALGITYVYSALMPYLHSGYFDEEESNYANGDQAIIEKMMDYNDNFVTFMEGSHCLNEEQILPIKKIYVHQQKKLIKQLSDINAYTFVKDRIIKDLEKLELEIKNYKKRENHW